MVCLSFTYHYLLTLNPSQVIGWPILYAKEASILGIQWPRGVLLHGPPGVGKTAAVLSVAKEFDASVHIITAGSIMGSYMGESERRLREAFAAAFEEARANVNVPVVVFLDDVDSLCPRRSPGQHHEARLVGQLLTLLDGAESGNRRRKPKPADNAQGIAQPSLGSLGERQQQQQQHQEEEKRETQTNTTASTIQENGSREGHVVVLAATSRPNDLDPALRRPGRIDKEIAIPVPDATAREAILQLYIQQRLMPLGYVMEQTIHDVAYDEKNIDTFVSSIETSGVGHEQDSHKTRGMERGTIRAIAEKTHGYTGADLWALCREAALESETSLNSDPTITSNSSGDGDRGPEKGSCSFITMSHFLDAMRHVGPSVARSVSASYSPASWEDVGGLEDVKKRLQQSIEWPITKSEAFKRLGIRCPRGVLLHGPPGCAKTTLARAAVTSSGATFIPLQGASLYSMYVGEGEFELREAFRRGRLARPSIIFVDELDMLVGKRSSRGEGGGGTDAAVRLLSTFLTEMDGLEQEEGVTVLATTNRPQCIDSALIRYVCCFFFSLGSLSLSLSLFSIRLCLCNSRKLSGEEDLELQTRLYLHRNGGMSCIVFYISQWERESFLCHIQKRSETSLLGSRIRVHAHMHAYIYIYACVYVCVHQ